MAKTLASMTDDELVEESQRLNTAREESNETLRQQMLAVKHEQDKRTALAALQEPLAALPEDMRQAVLAEALGGGGSNG